MIRKTLKKTSKSTKLKSFIKKYKVPREYLATSRKMVTRAVFLGVFIAFIPMPMQMLAVIAFIPFFKFNVPIALAMCWISNPLTMPMMYYVEYLTGSLLIGSEVAPVELTLEWFSENMGKIFIPLYVGTFFYAAIIASVAYYVVDYFWKTSVHRDKKLHRRDRKK